MLKTINGEDNKWAYSSCPHHQDLAPPKLQKKDFMLSPHNITLLLQC